MESSRLPPNLNSGTAFAAQGQLRQNQTYIGNRLMFARDGAVEASFANLVTGRLILWHLGMLIAAETVLWIACVAIPGAISLIALIQDKDPSGFYGFFTLIYWPLALMILVYAFMLTKFHPLSEWELLLDERSPSADSTYGAIYTALRRRLVPDHVYPLRVTSDPVRGITGNYLVVSQDQFRIYICVRPYGNGLYISWSMWHQAPYWRLYLDAVKLSVNTVLRRSSLMHQLMAAESARAMREAVHNAVRDGAEAALAHEFVDASSVFHGSLPPVRTVEQLPKDFDPQGPAFVPLAAPPPPRPPQPPAGWGG